MRGVVETLAAIVRSRAGDDAVGLRFEEQAWTWAEVVREQADRAAALSTVAEPAGRQRHVGVLLDNVPDHVFWIGAGALAGAAVVGLNSSRSAAEVVADATHAECDLVVTEPRLAHLVAGLDVPVHVVGTPAYDAWLAPHRGADLPAADPAPDDVALLLFSSGSTGAPKAVIVGHRRLARLTGSVLDKLGLHRGSVTYLCMPLFHGNAVMMNLVPATAVGATVCLARRFSASGFAPDVRRFGATYVNYVGRALSYVLAQPADPRDAGSTLELAYGTEASAADIERFAERFGCEVMEGYGLSEGVLRIGRTSDTPPGALGLPTPGLDVRILDEATGAECPPGGVGQIVAMGAAAAFEGYWKNPGAYAERVRGDDFWTGDLGYRDEDGWFWFAGRSSDWLRVDGENIAAGPMERVLAAAPGVAAAAVYAVPDPRTGDQVMATLEADGFDPAALAAYLEGRDDVGAKEWPRFVRVTERLPQTGSGKVDKAPLRRTAWLTADPVWVREDRARTWVPLTETHRERLRAELAEHGRAGLLDLSG